MENETNLFYLQGDRARNSLGNAERNRVVTTFGNLKMQKQPRA